jgi:hypothetical protein
MPGRRERASGTDIPKEIHTRLIAEREVDIDFDISERMR